MVQTIAELYYQTYKSATQQQLNSSEGACNLKLTTQNLELFLHRSRKLFQKPYIVLTEEADILNTILQQSRAFDAHSKCKA